MKSCKGNNYNNWPQLCMLCSFFEQKKYIGSPRNGHLIIIVLGIINSKSNQLMKISSINLTD